MLKSTENYGHVRIPYPQISFKKYVNICGNIVHLIF